MIRNWLTQLCHLFLLLWIKYQIQRWGMQTWPISCRGSKLLPTRICNVSRGVIFIQYPLSLWLPWNQNLFWNVLVVSALNKKQSKMQMIRSLSAWIQMLLRKSSKSLRLQNAWICLKRCLCDCGIKANQIIKGIPMLTSQRIREPMSLDGQK